VQEHELKCHRKIVKAQVRATKDMREHGRHWDVDWKGRTLNGGRVEQKKNQRARDARTWEHSRRMIEPASTLKEEKMTSWVKSPRPYAASPAMLDRMSGHDRPSRLPSRLGMDDSQVWREVCARVCVQM